MTKLFEVKATIQGENISFNVHAENKTSAVGTAYNLLEEKHGHLNYSFQVDEVDPSIQKMREMGFPERMITFHPEDTQETDFDTEFDEIMEELETHVETDYDPAKEVFTITQGEWDDIRDEHDNSINHIMRGKVGEQQRKLIHQTATHHGINIELLQSLSKDQLIDMLITHEMTLNTIASDLEIEMGCE